MKYAVPEIVAKFQGNDDENTRELAKNVLEMLAPDSPMLADWGLEMVVYLIDHAGIGQILVNMQRIVRECRKVAELLTPDRPIMNSGELIQVGDFVLLPIGPKKLFIAVGGSETLKRVQAYDAAVQAEAVNRFIVGRAQGCVYKTNGDQLEFVREHMDTKPEKTLFERLVEFRKRTGI